MNKKIIIFTEEELKRLKLKKENKYYIINKKVMENIKKDSK